MPRVAFGDRAEEELRRLLADLRRQSPVAAGRASQWFDDAITLLEQFPRAGPLTDHVGVLEYRVLLAGSYRMWYAVDAEDNVTVLYIRHVRQQPPDPLNLEGRAEHGPEGEDSRPFSPNDG